MTVAVRCRAPTSQAQIAAAQFANARDADEEKPESEQMRIAKNLQIDRQPRYPKEDRINKATISPRNCSSMCFVRLGDCPIMMPAANAPSTVCTPMKLVTSARAIMITRMMLRTGISMTK
jgi:hypothetical protein